MNNIVRYKIIKERNGHTSVKYELFHTEDLLTEERVVYLRDYTVTKIKCPYKWFHFQRFIEVPIFLLKRNGGIEKIKKEIEWFVKLLKGRS